MFGPSRGHNCWIVTELRCFNASRFDITGTVILGTLHIQNDPAPRVAASLTQAGADLAHGCG